MGEPAQVRDDRIERVVARITSHGDFPAAVQIVERLHAAVRKEDCAALEVARIVLADPGLSSKVLRAANSTFYRPSGQAISTITRAVILLGLETVRDLTTGIVLMDYFARTPGVGGRLGDALQRCLMCGLVARALSLRIGYPTPEEAYLLGLFSNLGVLCLAAHYPAELARAESAVADGTVALDDALVRELGIHPAEVATALLERWRFPTAYTDYFRQPAPGHCPPQPGATSSLNALVDLAAECTAGGDPAAAVADPALAERWVHVFRRPAAELAEAVRAAQRAFAEQAPLYGLRLWPPAPPPTETPVPIAVAPPPVEAAPSVPPALEILGEITRAILEGDDLTHVLSMTLEGVARTGGFDAVLLVLLTPARDRLIGRLGYGEGLREYLHAFDVPVAAGGLLAEAARSGKAEVVPPGGAAVLVPPGTAVPPVGAWGAVVVPIIVRRRTVGVLVAARSTGSAVGAADLALVQLFAQHGALALDRAAG